MNKQQIQELALQAGAKLGPYVHEVDLLQPDGTYKWDEERHTDTTTIDLEKFAELLVRECGELVKARLTHIPDNQDDWDGHNYGETAAVYGILDTFQEHFGVDCDQKNSKFGVEE